MCRRFQSSFSTGLPLFLPENIYPPFQIFQKSQPSINKEKGGGRCQTILTDVVSQHRWARLRGFSRGYYETKKSGGWTINRLRLNNSLTINGTTFRIAYRNIDVHRRTFSNFWGFCCSYHQIIAVLVLMSEGRDEKGGLVEKNLSEYSISKSKMQGIFESSFVSRWMK